jgi:hypothetical protein
MTRSRVGINGIRLYTALPLKTGQTTQYSSELDNGFYQTGVDKLYSVLTTGQYSGTANVDLIHYTAVAGHVEFVAATKKILDSDNGLALFKTGDKIICVGPAEAANILELTVATGNVAGEIVTTEALTNETPAGAVSIYKRESKSNNCVVDNNTGLMWMRDPSNYPAKMGVASDGKMEWTGKAYDIFQYCAACNTAAVGGYTDWRVPNIDETESISNRASSTHAPNTTAFPNWTFASYVLFTSTTRSDSDNMARVMYYRAGYGSNNLWLKSGTAYVALVRGGR